MARDQGIEEVTQGGQGLVLGGAVAGQLVDEAAGEAGGDLAELEVLVLAPGEETANDAGVGAAGVGVGDAGGEELVGGEQGIASGPLEDGGDGLGLIGHLGSGPEGGLGRVWVHGDIGDDNILYRTFPSYDSRAIFSVKGSLLAPLRSGRPHRRRAPRLSIPGSGSTTSCT